MNYQICTLELIAKKTAPEMNKQIYCDSDCSVSEQTFPIAGKNLQVLSYKVCGDSWTRTNNSIDMKEVLSVIGIKRKDEAQ